MFFFEKWKKVFYKNFFYKILRISTCRIFDVFENTKSFFFFFENLKKTEKNTILEPLIEGTLIHPPPPPHRRSIWGPSVFFGGKSREFLGMQKTRFSKKTCFFFFFEKKFRKVAKKVGKKVRFFRFFDFFIFFLFFFWKFWNFVISNILFLFYF